MQSPCCIFIFLPLHFPALFLPFSMILCLYSLCSISFPFHGFIFLVFPCCIFLLCPFTHILFLYFSFLVKYSSIIFLFSSNILSHSLVLSILSEQKTLPSNDNEFFLNGIKFQINDDGSVLVEGPLIEVLTIHVRQTLNDICTYIHNIHYP